MYALERWLARLVQSEFADSFVLKGGMLLAAFLLRRPTRDIDMQALDLTLDAEHLERVVAAVAAIDLQDGVSYAAVPSRVELIRDADEYAGLRVSVTARMHPWAGVLKLDISTGDPIVPGPERVVMPQLLGGSFAIAGHPPQTVVAEKSVTILQRGASSSRWRDYLDLRLLAETSGLRAGEIREAVEQVAAHRGVPLGSSLSALVAGYDGESQRKWAAWRRAHELEDRTAALLQEQLAAVCVFLDPVFLGEAPDAAAWDLHLQQWAVK